MKKEDVKGILYGKVGDFAKKVAPLYVSLKWTWHDENTPPTQDEIESVLIDLIDHFDGESCCSTGGLEVFYDKNHREIGIRFIYNDSLFF